MTAVLLWQRAGNNTTAETKCAVGEGRHPRAAGFLEGDRGLLPFRNVGLHAHVKDDDEQ